MGYKKELFISDDHMSFLCNKCQDVAIDPVTNSCCGQLRCKNCTIENGSCSNSSCEGKKFTSRPLSAAMTKEYHKLELKCEECKQIVTVGTFDRHRSQKYDELAELFQQLMKLNLKLEEEISGLKNENGNFRHLCLQQQEIINQMRDGQSDSGQDTDNWRNGRQSPRAPVKQTRILIPSSPPVFILDPTSKDVSYAIVDFLKTAIAEATRSGVKQPMKVFFDPIRIAMNKKIGGNWQNYDAKLFDKERANCLKEREVRYKIQWNIPQLGTTDHVTFDLNSARK